MYQRKNGKLVKVDKPKVRYHSREAVMYPSTMPRRAITLATRMFEAMRLVDRIDQNSREDRAWAALFVAFSEIGLMQEPTRSEFYEAARAAHDEFVEHNRDANNRTFGAPASHRSTLVTRPGLTT